MKAFSHTSGPWCRPLYPHSRGDVKVPLNLRTKKIQTLGTTFIFNILNQSLTVGFRPPPNTKKATVRGQEVNLRPSPRNEAIYRPFSNPQPPRSESNTSLKLPLLLIPESQTEPLTHHEITLGLDTSAKIARLLGCSLTDSVVLHSEDQIAYVCFFTAETETYTNLDILRQKTGATVLGLGISTHPTKPGWMIMPSPTGL